MEWAEAQTTETSKGELMATASPKFHLHLIRAFLHRDMQESQLTTGVKSAPIN